MVHSWPRMAGAPQGSMARYSRFGLGISPRAVGATETLDYSREETKSFFLSSSTTFWILRVEVFQGDSRQ